MSLVKNVGDLFDNASNVIKISHCYSISCIIK